MQFTTKQLANVLNISQRSAYRVAASLQFVKRQDKHRIYYCFEDHHPLIKSIQLLYGSAKPIYSVADIAKLWQWSRGCYCKERVRQLLDKFDIPIYNKKNKGLIYLCDLKKILR